MLVHLRTVCAKSDGHKTKSGARRLLEWSTVAEKQPDLIENCKLLTASRNSRSTEMLLVVGTTSSWSFLAISCSVSADHLLTVIKSTK